MDKELKSDLQEVIKEKLEDLRNLEPGTEEHSRVAEDINKLYRLIQEDEKQEWSIESADIEDDRKEREYERGLEKEKREAKRFWAQLGITTGVTVATSLAALWVRDKNLQRILKYETEGSITSLAGRNIAQDSIRLFKPKK